MEDRYSDFVRFGLTCGLVVMLCAGCGRKDVPSIAQTKAIAEEGFVFGLPIVMNYAVMFQFNVDKTSSQYKAPFNVIANEARVFTPKDTAIVSPSSDTPYSLIMMDLRSEPFVLSVPAVAKPRYYSVQLTDGNCFDFGYIGSRATGTEPGDYMVVGPDWKGDTPAQIKKVFHSSTQFAAAIYRTQLFNPADMPNVIKVQSGYKGQPLSAFLKQPGKYLLHHSAASEHVRNPTGDAEIVLQNHKVPLRVSYQIRTDHSDVDVARHFDTAHFPAVMFAGVNNVTGHDAVFNDFSLMIDIFEEEIQRCDPLS
jgi:hypothetical protein